MKRKILTLALGLSMLFGLMVNANAAASPVGDIVKPDESNPVGTAVVTDASQLPAAEAAVLSAALEAVSAAPAAEFLESAGVTAAVTEALANTNVAVEDLTAVTTFSLNVSEETAKILAEGGSVELTFTVDGIADGDTVVVLVFNGTSWDVVPAVVKDGKVVGTFKSVGAVVIMKADDAAAPAVTSPKTSGTNLEGVLISGAVLSLAVLALCIKRSRMA